MKISYQWLSDFVDFTERDPQKIAERLTAGMGEIDEVEVQGELLTRCVVGKVLSIEKHPSADKLFLCDVETEQGTKRVVCGGTNLRVGMLVAFAHVGATVKWHGGETMTLSRVKIRGQESEGMICAAEELGLGSEFPSAPEDGERPIIDLSQLAVGTPLKKALGLDDAIFHVDNHAITHRPDLFSHLGVARECVALGLAAWKKRKQATSARFTSEPLPFRFKLEIPSLVPRYLGCVLTIEDVGVTPEQMTKRLRATGWRGVNLPVDITNYVAMDVGMPLHSFDVDDIHGDIHMRLSREGESIITLDGVERPLPKGAIILSDDHGIFDLMGIMGGLRSSTKPSSRRLFLHAAVVDPALIRRTILATGHRTEASTVYEKGIPPVTASIGFFRALELFIAHVPGCKPQSRLEQWGSDGRTFAIKLPHARIVSTLGIDVKPAAAANTLRSLDCSVSIVKGKTATLSVRPPLHRKGDLKGPHDLVEEVGRLLGYNKIAPLMPTTVMHLPARDPRLHTVCDALCTAGYTEFLQLSFVSPELLSQAGFDPGVAVRVENPLGEELSLMRLSLLPGLLQALSRQMEQHRSDLKVFERGKVFEKDGERTELCILSARAHGPVTLPDDPFLGVKADLTRSLASVGYAVDYVPSGEGPPQAHPGRSADIHCQGKLVGTLFEIHPSIRSAFSLPERTAVAIVQWDTLFTLKPKTHVFVPLSDLPSVDYHETFSLPFSTSLSELLSTVRTRSPLLASVEIVNLYQKGEEKRVTLNFEYRAKDRTLTEEEAEKAHRDIVQFIQSKHAHALAS